MRLMGYIHKLIAFFCIAKSVDANGENKEH